MLNKRRVMVDMSATILHHGHIRLLKTAANYGTVVVALTTDKEIADNKWYKPELGYLQRKEIIESIQYVSEVVSSPWLITESFLDKHNIALLIHGDDNANDVPIERLLVLPRTKGVSSTRIRDRVQSSIAQMNNRKLMLTPGPAAVLYENIQNIKPVFGRGDDEYTDMATKVLEWIKVLSGQDQVVMAQGSATFALELAAATFVRGNILLVSSGYYSRRLENFIKNDCTILKCSYKDIVNIKGNFDWIICAYTETSHASKIDLKFIREKANQFGAYLYVDATGSIGLEDNHELADVMAFSSCKGLFGLAGACFIAYKNYLKHHQTNHYYFNLETHEKNMVTGPYHTIASLYGIIKTHDRLKERVKRSKHYVMEKWSAFIRNNDNQPLLCTYLHGKVVPKDDSVVLYAPRMEASGSVICHLGEIHKDDIDLGNRIIVNKID